MENENLNVFRRLGSRMVGGAYVEGWGLYAERLADEMGLYRDEAERFGMLDGQAWRAARLVVDSGLHALRWPRQRSVDTLLGAGLTPTDATIETDRYIAWPGQALTYKLGQREIERLRRRDLGPRRLRFRPARLPRRGPRPRLAAPGDPGPRAPELGRHPGVDVSTKAAPILSIPIEQPVWCAATGGRVRALKPAHAARALLSGGDRGPNGRESASPRVGSDLCGTARRERSV